MPYGPVSRNYSLQLPTSTRKTLTFTGAAGLGAVGNVPFFTVTGLVIVSIVSRCITDLAGATATLALGVTGSTALFIAATLATDIDADEIWVDATPYGAGIAHPAAVKDITIRANIVGTVATANITGGVLEVSVWWRPWSADGLIVAQ